GPGGRLGTEDQLPARGQRTPARTGGQGTGACARVYLGGPCSSHPERLSMKRTYLSTTDLRYLLPLSLIAGAFFAAIQRGNFAGGFLAFSFLFLVFVVLLRVAYAWTGAGKTLAIIMALAFLLRLIVGVALHLGLPVFGHDDEDDRAGYV